MFEQSVSSFKSSPCHPGEIIKIFASPVLHVSQYRHVAESPAAELSRLFSSGAQRFCSTNSSNTHFIFPQQCEGIN